MHLVSAVITDRTGPRGLGSSTGDEGGLGSRMEGSAIEFVLDPICIDGRSGFNIGEFSEGIESLR